MNKRQKKKNIAKAIERYQAHEATSKDYRVLRTYGRKELLETYSLPRDLDVGKLFDGLASAIDRIVQQVADSVHQFAKTLTRMQENGELARMAERAIKEKDEKDSL